MSAYEVASGRPMRNFPVEWGQPLGVPYSEERGDWIRAKVAEHAALTAHRKLADKQGRLLAIYRAAQMAARREPDDGGPSAA